MKLPTARMGRKSSSTSSNSHLLRAKVVNGEDLETTLCTVYFTYWTFFFFGFSPATGTKVYIWVSFHEYPATDRGEGTVHRTSGDTQHKRTTLTDVFQSFTTKQ